MRLTRILFLLCVCGVLSCRKNHSADAPPDPVPAGRLDYGSDVFYIKNASYKVVPANGKRGTYTAFPNSLEIDPATGAITISLKDNQGESQTGLRYRINYRSEASGETDSTFIVVSGLSYVDRFYFLDGSDSMIRPVYNGDPSKTIPAGSYDASGNSRFALDPNTGLINIRECVRRGFFDNQANAHWKQQTIKYHLNDGSNSITNSIDVIIYYYNTLNDVPSNVSALMQVHQRMSVGVNTSLPPSTPGAVDNNLSSDLSLSKPRPPCIIIVGH